MTRRLAAPRHNHLNSTSVTRRLAAPRITYWRRRAVALLVVAGIAAALWVALADGTAEKAPSAKPSSASGLPAAQLAGQRLIAGFPGPRPPERVRRMIRHGELAGVVLFSENVGTRRHARRLIRGLQRIRQPKGLRRPLLIMIDQEGGLVKRLSGPPDASAQAMGRRGRRYSRRQGARTAENLKGVGVNVNLAPVLDVGRPGSAIRSEHRSFGGKPRRVIKTAVPFAKAMERNGIAATAKHFPGLGAAKQNTDFAVQRIRLSRAKLRRIDERPYRSFVADHGDLVMISTAVYTHFSDKPAAFTKRIATGELRRRLGFGGVSITDALETTAAADFGGPAKVGVAAARAGMDLLLYGGYRAAAHAGHALRRKLRSGALKRSGFEESVQRVLDLRASLSGG